MTTRPTGTRDDLDADVIAMIRRQARRDEPAFAIPPGVVLDAGRRHLRSRRISLALRTAAAAVVVACVAALPAPAHGTEPDVPTASTHLAGVGLP